jgi:hypothetical protein
MSMDERLSLLAAGEASAWQAIVAGWHLTYSAHARRKYQRYVAVSQLLRRTLADTDDTVHVKLHRRPQGRLAFLALVGLLFLFGGVVASEWNRYIAPAVYEWTHAGKAKCKPGDEEAHSHDLKPR